MTSVICNDLSTQKQLGCKQSVAPCQLKKVPNEVMNCQKLAISYCGRVVAVLNMQSVDLLATSSNINDPFDDDSNTNTPGTTLGLLESILNKELHKICELPVRVTLICHMQLV